MTQATTNTTAESENLVGLLAEFDQAEALVRAAARATEAGYRRVEAYSPMPVEGLPEALGFRRNRLPVLVLLGGLVGGGGALALQYWASAVHYVLNIGGRPPASWPLFMPVTFECTVLVAALAAVLGMLALNGLPRPHHPLFDVEGFERATTDRFFLYVQSRDPRFDPRATREFLETLDPLKVLDVQR